MAKKSPKKAKSEKGKSFILRSVAMPKEIDARLAALAESEDRSLSYCIARAVREYLDRKDKGTPNA